jgi:hypothetical protein
MKLPCVIREIAMVAASIRRSIIPSETKSSDGKIESDIPGGLTCGRHPRTELA